MSRWANALPNREEQLETKRKAIIREAARVFSRRGVHGTSLDDVAERLGVTKAALYRYVPSKQDLLYACHEEAMEIARESMDKGEAEGRTGLEKIRIGMASYQHSADRVGNFVASGSGQVAMYESLVRMVSPTGEWLGASHIVPVMVAGGLAAPLAKSYLTNLGNLAPTFVNPVFDPGNTYSIAYQWGTTGYAYRTDKIQSPPDSWSVFLDAKYKGKMTQMDDMRDVIGAWLRYRGKSLNSTVEAELQAAKADALASKKNLKAYISAPVKGQLVSGDVWIAQLWNGDTAQAKKEQPNLGYILPKEGCTIWTDSLMIPKSAPHKRAAHEFINYVLRPEVGAAISNFTGYGSPNQASMAAMETPVPYPTAEEFQRLEYQKDLGEAGALWDQIWTEIKSA